MDVLTVQAIQSSCLLKVDLAQITPVWFPLISNKVVSKRKVGTELLEVLNHTNKWEKDFNTLNCLCSSESNRFVRLQFALKQHTNTTRALKLQIQEAIEI